MHSQPSNLLFAAPHLLKCTPCSSSNQLSHRCSRRPIFRMSSSKPPSNRTPPSHPNNGDIPFARFSEFSASAGNTKLQNDLVREVLWEATRAATTQNMESTIQEEIDAVSDMLSDMYSRGERDITQKNEERALRASLPNISKWNQQLIEGHKESKKRKKDIIDELQIVDALLRRETRKTRRLSKRRFRKSSTTLPIHSVSQPQSDTPITSETVSISPTNAFLFTVTVCVVALESFDGIATQENGPSQLAHYAAFTAMAILSCAYLHSLRSAYQKSSDDLKKRGVFIDTKQ